MVPGLAPCTPPECPPNHSAAGGPDKQLLQTSDLGSSEVFVFVFLKFVGLCAKIHGPSQNALACYVGGDPPVGEATLAVAFDAGAGYSRRVSSCSVCRSIDARRHGRRSFSTRSTTVLAAAGRKTETRSRTAHCHGRARCRRPCEAHYCRRAPAGPGCAQPGQDFRQARVPCGTDSTTCGP